ncbi:beta strand repeat-containing protein [Leucobacter coleopterorum]|uniref:beta strand repeat-containing protein n=1 Tax=Leucobacter coleopterorum TaxID=2714933 RepID=UPI00197FB87D|nr:invasin domain 3-containing protein [Leucobacter coleopterorum]
MSGARENVRRVVAVTVTFLLVLSGFTTLGLTQSATPANALSGDVIGSVDWPADANLRNGGVFAIARWDNSNPAFGFTTSSDLAAIVGTKATPTRAVILRNTANTGYRSAVNLAVSANVANQGIDGIWTTPGLNVQQSTTWTAAQTAERDAFNATYGTTRYGIIEWSPANSSGLGQKGKTYEVRIPWPTGFDNETCGMETNPGTNELVVMNDCTPANGTRYMVFNPGPDGDPLTLADNSFRTFTTVTSAAPNNNPGDFSDMTLDALGNVYNVVNSNMPSNSGRIMKTDAQTGKVSVVADFASGTGYTLNNTTNGLPVQDWRVNQSERVSLGFLDGKVVVPSGYSDNRGANLTAIDPLLQRPSFVKGYPIGATGWNAAGTTPTSNNTWYDGAGVEGAVGLSGVVKTIDGTPLANQTVAIYRDNGDGTATLQGSRTTDANGVYESMLNWSAGVGYVRVVQPKLTTGTETKNGEVVAIDASLKANDGTNSVEAINETNYGANPPLGTPLQTKINVNEVTDLVKINGNNASAYYVADFQVAVAGSTADLSRNSLLSSDANAGVGPQHVNVDGDTANDLRIGAVNGLFTVGATNNSHASDDGVFLKLEGENRAIGGQLLAQGKKYRVLVDNQGAQAANAKVSAWMTAPGTQNASPRAAFGAKMAASGAQAEFDLTTPASAPTAANSYSTLRVNSSLVDVEKPSNADGEYAALPTQTDKPWVTAGEVEDYEVRTVPAVSRFQVNSKVPGNYNFNVSNTTNSPATLSLAADAKSTAYGLTTAGNDMLLTNTAVPAGASLKSAKVIDSVTGAALGNATVTGNNVTIPGALLAAGSDVRVVLNYLEAPNPAASTFVLAPDSVVADDTTEITATVTVIGSSSGAPAAGQIVSIKKQNSSDPFTISSVTDNGDGTYTAKLKSAASGSYAVKAFVDVNGTDQQVGPVRNAVFTAGGPVVGTGKSELTIDDNKDRVADGADRHTITATLKDANNNPVVGVAGSLTSSVADNAGNPVVVSAFTETAAGVYTATVTSTKAGSKSVTVTYDATLKIGTVNANFAAGPVDPANPGSSFTVSEGNQTAGSGSHSVTVKLADANGNPVSGKAIGLTGAATGGAVVTGFVESATPGTYTANVTSATKGSKTVTVKFGSDALTAGANDKATFVSGEVDTSVTGTRFTVSSGNQIAGSGNHTVTVTLADAGNNPVSGKAADLTGAATGGALVTGFVEAPGNEGTYTATVTSLTTGTKTVTVNVGGSAVTAGANDKAVFVAGTVLPGHADTRFWVSTGAQTVGSGSHTVTVTLRDAYGNAVSGAAAPLTWSANPSQGVTQASGFVETATPGTYTATVKSTVSGAKVISVKFDGASILVGGVTNNATALFIAGAVDPAQTNTKFSVTTGDATAVTGSHQVTVTLVDSFDNPVTNQAADLSGAASGGAVVGAFTETVGKPGEYTAQITSATAGSKNVTVSHKTAGAVTASGNATAKFVTGGVDTNNAGTTYDVTTGTRVVGSGSHTLTVKLADANGLAVSGQSAGITPAVTGGAVIGAFTESGATPGTYTAAITSTTPGTKNVTVKFGADPINLDKNGAAVFEVGPVDPSKTGTTYSVTGGEAPVVGGAHTVTVTLVDSLNNAIPGQAANLVGAADGGAVVGGFQESVVTPGTYTAQVTSATPGDKTVAVTHTAAGPLSTTANRVAKFVTGGVDTNVASTNYTVTTGNLLAGSGAHTVTVNLTDSIGNPVSGQAAGLTGASSAGGVVGAFTPTTTAGEYVAQVTSLTPGTRTITVTYGANAVGLKAGGNDKAVFVVGAVDPNVGGTGYSVTTGTRIAGSGAHTVTVTLADSFGNVIAGQAANLTGAATAGGVVGSFTETATAGTYTAEVTSATVGVKTVTVKHSGNTINPSGPNTAEFTAGVVFPGDPNTRFWVSTGAQTVGSGSHTVSVTLRDENGNAVSGVAAPLTWSATPNQGVTQATGFVETATPGTYTATIKSTVSGAKVIAVKFDGASILVGGVTNNATALFTSGNVDTGQSGTKYSVTTGDATAVTGSHQVTVTLVDGFDNPVTNQAAELTGAASGGAVVGAFTESVVNPGEYTAQITSATAGSKNVTVSHQTAGAVTAAGNATAKFVTGGVDTGHPGTKYNVTEGTRVVGSGAHTLTVTLKDANGLAVSNQSAGITAAATGGAVIGAFTESGGTPGTYTAQITSDTPGAKNVTVKFGADLVNVDQNGAAVFVVGPVDPTQTGTNYSVTGGEAPVVGGSHTVTVTLVDSLKNPISGQAANLAGAADGGAVVGAFTESVLTPGTYTAQVTATTPGDKAVAVTHTAAGALNANGNKVAKFVTGGVDTNVASTNYTVTTGNLLAGSGAHTVTVNLTDSIGNPVSGQAAGLTGASSAGGVVGAFTPTTTAGEYVAQVTSLTPGTRTITVTYGANAVGLKAGGNDKAVFVVGAVDPNVGGTGYSVTTGTRIAGSGAHTVTVTLADSFGNVIAGQAASLTGAVSGGAAVGAFAETATAGTYTAEVTSATVGVKTVTVKHSGTTINASGPNTAEFTAGTVDPNHSGTRFTVSQGEQTAGLGSHTVTAKLKDSYGNAVSGQAAQLSWSSANSLGVNVVTGFVETATPGTYTALILSSSAGNKVISVLHGADPITFETNRTATFIPGGVSVGNAGTKFSVSTGTRVAGSGTHTVTATLADENGNAVSGQAGPLSWTANASLGAGAVTPFTETATPGTYTAVINSTLAGAKVVTASYGSSVLARNGNDTATFVAGGVDTGNAGTKYTVSQGTRIAGSGSHTVTVTLRDAHGNVVSGEAAPLSWSSATSLGVNNVTPFVETATPAPTPP